MLTSVFLRFRMGLRKARYSTLCIVAVSGGMLLIVYIWAKKNNAVAIPMKPTLQVAPPIGKGPPILLWWDSVYTSVDMVKQCGKFRCRVTSDRSLQQHPDTQVFLFYGSHFKPFELPFPRRRNSLWALIHEESPRNAFILSHGDTMSLFNMTSTYQQLSDYPITTQWLQCADWLQDNQFLIPLATKNRLRAEGLAPILYLQSDCGVPSDRDRFVKLLQKHIRVDSYGTCLRNKDMPEQLRFHGNMAPLDDTEFFQFAARYKFTLAMENYICDDYITEKIWRPLRLGSVPIIFGAPNIRDFLPSKASAILIEDFRNVEELSNYIRLLDSHDELYLKYLDFKTEPIQNKLLEKHLASRDWQPSFCNRTTSSGHSKYTSPFYGYECFLCEKVHGIREAETSSVDLPTSVANSSHYRCPAPKRVDVDGRYTITDYDWSVEWRHGIYEAKALQQLRQEQRTISEQEFRKLVQQLAMRDHFNKILSWS